MEKRFIDQFILVEYNGLQYPKGYSASMHEVAAHFDKKSIDPKGDYSLHTEYSYGTRKLDSCRIAKYPFLSGIQRICSDGSPRFLVPEVNSGEADLSAIINDLSFRN
jgi:hypothetical protein